MPVGAIELVLVLVVLLIVFGPGKLPRAGEAIGRTIADLRRAATDDEPRNESRESTP
jgi:sec-independent protein translocase protein TatA